MCGAGSRDKGKTVKWSSYGLGMSCVTAHYNESVQMNHMEHILAAHDMSRHG